MAKDDFTPEFLEKQEAPDLQDTFSRIDEAMILARKRHRSITDLANNGSKVLAEMRKRGVPIDTELDLFKTLNRPTLKAKIHKGFTNGTPEGGVHTHGLLRNDKATTRDGVHLHMFAIRLEGGELMRVVTEEDGDHWHSLDMESSMRANAGKMSAHNHQIIVPRTIVTENGLRIEEGAILVTEIDGAHEHGTPMLDSSNFDGEHKHNLIFNDGTSIRALDIQEFWEMFGPFDLRDVPPHPPASRITQLVEEELFPPFEQPIPESALEEDSMAMISALNEGVNVELGSGDIPLEGYIGVDKEGNPTVKADLNEGMPFPNDSVDKVRATDILQFLVNKQFIMSEIHRVLKPGGILEFAVPSTRGQNAFSHPDHISFFDIRTFDFFTDPVMLEGRPQFDVEKIEEKQMGEDVFVMGILKKPKDEIYKVEHIKKAGTRKQGTEIQTLIFPNEKFTRAQALSFARRHGFKTSKVDETDTSFRIRQKDPDDFSRIRTISLADSGGVKATVGVRKRVHRPEDKKKKKTLKAKEILNEIVNGDPIKIVKLHKKKQIAVGIVLRVDKFDSQDDTMVLDEVEKTAHNFLKDSRVIGLQHTGPANAELVESAVVLKGDTFKGVKMQHSAWVIAVHVSDRRTWLKVVSGEINSFSPGGFGLRKPA